MEFSNASGTDRNLGWGFDDNCAAFRSLIVALSNEFADEEVEFRDASGAGRSFGRGFGNNCAVFRSLTFGFLGIEFGRGRT